MGSGSLAKLDAELELEWPPLQSSLAGNKYSPSSCCRIVSSHDPSRWSKSSRLHGYSVLLASSGATCC